MRNPAAGVVSGAVGLVWAAMGLALAGWAATAALDPAKGAELAAWALDQAGRPAMAERWLGYALAHIGVVAIVGVVFLAAGAKHLRKARIALRPATESHDGKGEIQLPPADPRVGRAFEGSIRLREAPMPGEEFDVILTALKNGRVAHRMEQKTRARPGAHGVNLPFRFDVPASAPASGIGTRWRLEFAPAGRRVFGRSAFDVTLAAAPEGEVRMAAASTPHPHHGLMQQPAALTPAASGAHGYVEHIEKLAGALGRKLTDAQREQLRAKLSGPEAAAMKRQLDLVRKLEPQHLKLVKYAVIGVIALFFVLPFVMSILGAILAAVAGR